MIWGYPHWWKPPYSRFKNFEHHLFCFSKPSCGQSVWEHLPPIPKTVFFTPVPRWISIGKSNCAWRIVLVEEVEVLTHSFRSWFVNPSNYIRENSKWGIPKIDGKENSEHAIKIWMMTGASHIFFGHLHIDISTTNPTVHLLNEGKLANNP